MALAGSVPVGRPPFWSFLAPALLEKAYASRLARQLGGRRLLSRRAEVGCVGGPCSLHARVVGASGEADAHSVL